MERYWATRFVSRLPVVFLFIAGVLNVSGAAGDLDLTFNAAAYSISSGESVNVIRKQPDGKYLVGGKFIKVNGFAAPGLLRLNADLTVDTNFNPPEFTNLANTG